MPRVTVLRADWNRAQLIAKAEAEAAQAAADEAATTKSGKKKGRQQGCRVKVSIEEALDAVDLPLFLPSSVTGHFRQNKKLMDFEFRLHEAESYECLMTLRRQLIFRSHIYKFKDQNVTGQLMSTRARSTISSVIKNIDEAAARYRKLQADLVVLAMALGDVKAGWDRQLRVLNAADVRPLDETMPGETEGRRAMSWIWRVHCHDTDAEETAEGMSILAAMFSDPKNIVVALRIEWCKTHARAHRWREEVNNLFWWRKK